MRPHSAAPDAEPPAPAKAGGPSALAPGGAPMGPSGDAVPPLGQQLALDLMGCQPEALRDAAGVEAALREAAQAAGATVVAAALHAFPGGGVSGVLVLAESHLAIHTWPEAAYAAVDGFVCGGQTQADGLVGPLVRALGANRWRSAAWQRGLDAPWPPM